MLASPSPEDSESKEASITHPISKSDVEQFMWRKLPRNSDSYRRVADAIVADPDGQVAVWCDEVRQQIIERMDGAIG